MLALVVSTKLYVNFKVLDSTHYICTYTAWFYLATIRTVILSNFW